MFHKVNKFIAIIFIGIIYFFNISFITDVFQNSYVNFKLLKNRYFIKYNFNSLIVPICVITKYLCSNKINDTVYIGKDWWLFYLEGSSKDDFIGNKYFSKEQKENFKNKIEQINNYLQQKKIKFILIIVPNKEQIYYDNMPCTMKKYSEFNRTDDLLNYLNKEFIIYPKKEMLQLSNEYELYYKYDSHWTEIGAYITLQEINQKVYNKKNYLNKNLIYYDYSLTSPNDIVQMFYFDNIFKENFKVRIKEQSLYKDKNNKKTVVLVGDSFKDTLVSILNFDYSLLSVFDKKRISSQDLDDLIKNKPDIFILETAERKQYGIINTISELLDN